jgi:hypothetical protein
MERMRIGLLGPLELRDADDRPVEVTGARQRVLLCRLALDPVRLITTGRRVARDALRAVLGEAEFAAAWRRGVARVEAGSADGAGPEGEFSGYLEEVRRSGG